MLTSQHGLRVGRVRPDQHEAIVSLHSHNLIGNLEPDARADGYLSVPLSVEQVAEANRDLAVVVGTLQGCVVGYAMATSIGFNSQFPLIQHMIAIFDQVCFQGVTLSELNPFFYGPVCVERELRGKGVLQELFDALCSEVKPRNSVGVTFVAAYNARSLEAHKRKLGMVCIRCFNFQGRDYEMLCFSL